MPKIMIIGAGGVAGVAAYKCAQAHEHFERIMLASRSISKCIGIRDRIKEKTGVEIEVAEVNAEDVPRLVSLIRSFKPDVVLNLALPYQDLKIMDACLEAGANYVDTANYEPEDVAHFEYSWQWAYKEKFKERGLIAVLGCGFDPGVSNIFSAFAQKHLFDEIHYIDILDCNAGNHGHPFATNFNPEINIREVTQVVRHWENGRWVETPSILNPGSVHFPFDYPVVGKKESYLLYHEELESLAKNIHGLKRIRFWMTFSENYINYLRVLQDVGMTRIDEVDYEGSKVVPIRFLKCLLPDPASLGSNYTGKTVIGNVITGIKDGREKSVYIYNVCDHSESFKEAGAQAISYTTGVPAMIAAMLVANGTWKGSGVFNAEEMDPDPFMELLGRYGLPWEQKDFAGRLPD